MLVKASTKSQYALRTLVNITSKEGFVSLHDVSLEENISYGYLEEIVSCLKKAGIVESKAGRSGGYRLKKDPKDVKISEVVEIFEGKTAPVKCLAGHKCVKEKGCKTRIVWSRVRDSVDDALGKMTLKNIL